MNHILVLVDFTTTATISLNQGIVLAKEHDARISLCHIAKSYYKEIPEELQKQMAPFQKNVEMAGVKCQVIFGQGDLIEQSKTVVEKQNPDLVIVGTHGKVGLKQNLFGSTIYKLVKSIPAPTLVINDNCAIRKDGFKRILLPVAPHSNFQLKVEQTSSILSKEGCIYIFAVIKPGGELDVAIKENIEHTKKLLDYLNVKWEYIEIKSEQYSVGYSKMTLEYAISNDMELVSIMIDVSNTNQHFGAIDKENMLLNTDGIPIFCTNS